jgi:predicted RNase H-like HicB family nuclease
VAETEAEVRKMIREAIVFHLQGMRLKGEAILAPTSRVGYVEVEEAAAVV